jgi:hypothetical protein
MRLPCKKSQKVPKAKFHQLWHFGSPDQHVKELEAQQAVPVTGRQAALPSHFSGPRIAQFAIRFHLPSLPGPHFRLRNLLLLSSF